MERITGKPIVTYMRLKRVRPTRSRCIRKLRAIRRTLLVEPLYLLESETPEMLFWSLLREGAFPCEDDIFDHINKLIGIGYPVQGFLPREFPSHPHKKLTLPLKKKWFEMIKSGEKKEEYREINEYWKKRLTLWLFMGESFRDNDVIVPKEYDTITFTLGYPRKDDTELSSPRIS